MVLLGRYAQPTSTSSEKRTICEIIGSNFTATGKDIDITLYPVFYDIIDMNNAKVSEKARFELSETQSEQQKRASKKALNLNGGTDEAHCVCLRSRKM